MFYADFYQFLCDDSSPTSSALLREVSEELFNQDIMVDVSHKITMTYSTLVIVLYNTPIVFIPFNCSRSRFQLP